MQNPLVYGVKELSKSNNKDLTCTCIFEPDKNPLIRRPILEVNKDGKSVSYIGGEVVRLK